MEINITIKIDDEEIKKLFGIGGESKEDLEEGYEGNSGKTDRTDVSQYARIFDENCPGWTKNPEYNMCYIKAQQDFVNDILRAKGYVFLNDVYEMLGFPRTKAGQVVGWTYDRTKPYGDNFIDFGLYDDLNGNNDFVNGRSSNVLLDFNVDGNILDRI